MLNMETVHVCRHQVIESDEPGEPICLVVDLDMREEMSPPEDLESAEFRFARDARRVMKVLNRLPQGTLHQVLIELLAQKVEYYIGK